MGIAFEEFWAIYPRKVGKIDAQKAYEKAILLTTIDKIRVAAQSLAARSKTMEPQYIPHPATWLNQGRWDDQPVAIASKTFMPKQFPEEVRYTGRPRALNWANVFVSVELPQYSAMLERSNSFDADPREYRRVDNGIWVSLNWLQDRPWRTGVVLGEVANPS
jgi:hypothetical protein